MAFTILVFITGFILFEFILSKTLSYLNLKTWDKPLPEAVKGLYDAEKYTQAKEYAIANGWGCFLTPPAGSRRVRGLGQRPKVLLLFLSVILWLLSHRVINFILRGLL